MREGLSFQELKQLYHELKPEKVVVGITCQPALYQKVMSRVVQHKPSIPVPNFHGVEIYSVTHQKEPFREWYDRDYMRAWIQMMESEHRGQTNE